MEKRQFDPMIGQWADPDKIQCRTCAFRDKEIVVFEGMVKAVGVTRDTCEMFDGTEDFKPHDVLFMNAECPYYLEEI